MPTKSRILVVDDEIFYLDVLQNLLRDEYDIVVAKDGEQALYLAAQQPAPDLILLDIMLPGIDGFEVCDRLKQQPETQSIPVIFLTVKMDVDDELKGFELGAVDYITKPISPPILKARVKTHLRMTKLIKQLEAMVYELKHS